MDVRHASRILEHVGKKWSCADNLHQKKRDQKSKNTAGEGDDQSFKYELSQYVTASCTEGFTDADFTCSFRHRNKHDVHHTDATDQQRQSPDHTQHNPQPSRYSANDLRSLYRIIHRDCALITRIKPMSRAKHFSNLTHGTFLKRGSDRLKNEIIHVLIWIKLIDDCIRYED